ncbi:hypothetical protein [Kineococcus sp. SYSU DK003]|uniref:hypothetical protein n=1 Tax=Kineococcus sp. SYSU DK003 TaxID=3383124 RepID=UPI003D7DFF81
MDRVHQPQAFVRRRLKPVAPGLIMHSAAGSQYTSLRLTEHLAIEGSAASIGSVGDADHTALMETAIGFSKTRPRWRAAGRVSISCTPGETTVARSARRRRAELETERSKAPPGERDLEVGFGFLRGPARPPHASTRRYIEERQNQLGVELGSCRWQTTASHRRLQLGTGHLPSSRR